MRAKEALNAAFKDIEFDKKLIDRLVRNNIEFMTGNPEVRDFMGSKLIGCFHLTYTQYHKNIFYEDVFGISYDTANQAVKDITTIPKSFKVSLDDVNMICFYMAHRFLSNKNLTKEEKLHGAKEALNYFGYRTLILICARWWKYPITRDKAVSLSESLSGNYLITKMKNWNEYVHYRSDEYLNSKFLKLLTTFDNDKDLPNAINDLFNRYKEMIKNIYRDFLALDDSDLLRSSKNVVTDNEGKEVLMDRLSDPRIYADKVKNCLISEDMFIRQQYMEVTASIIASTSQDQIEEMLVLTYSYYHMGVKANKEINEFIESFMIDSIGYLKSKRLELNNRSNVVEVVSMITGNLLYSRGTDISITIIKDRGEKLLKQIYKRGRVPISSRNLTKIRNAFCIYILLLGLI